MRNYKHFLRHLMTGMIAVCALFIGGASAASAQEASTTYRGSGRDPFRTYRPPPPSSRRARPVPVVPIPVDPPPIQQRIDAYRTRKQAAMMAQQTPPKPTVALLLSEIQVTGIFRTPRGYAAMIEATPINMSYVIYPGEIFFDGQLVAVEENRLVFRRETRWTDGRRQVTVDTKPLRQPNAVTNSLASTRQAQTGASAQPSDAVTTGAASSIANRVEANATSQHTMNFRSGQSVSIRLRGDGDTDLDLFIFGPTGNQVASDISLDDNEVATFQARETGTYRIEVRNLGSARNQYRLWEEQ